jgi:hypothetical protein
MSVLDQAKLDQFDEQGYVVVEGLLDQKEDIQPLVEEYSALLDSLAEWWYAEGKLSSTYSDLPFGRRLTRIAAEGMPYYQHLDISPQLGDTEDDIPMHCGPAVFNLITSPRLLDAVECFVGPEIYANPVQHVRIKPPEKLVPVDIQNSLTAGVAWHQDAGVVLPEADDTSLLSVWLAITDATLENSCLLLAPGSHKRPEVALHCLNFAYMGAKDVPQLTIPDRFLGPKQTPVPMKSGDVLFFHKRTMHRALPNVSDEIRWSFDLRYNPVGEATGRPWLPGYVVRSRAHPASELTDYAAWVELWQRARVRLAKDKNVPLHRWKEDDPRCA